MLVERVRVQVSTWDRDNCESYMEGMLNLRVVIEALQVQVRKNGVKKG